MTRLWIVFLCTLAFAQPPAVPTKRPNRPPKPGIKTPGVVRPITTITPTHVFKIEKVPDWVAVGPDAIWFSRRPDSTLNRLDAAKNEIVATIPIGKRQCSGMVYGFDSMWLPHCGEDTLYRVDVKQNKVVATIPLAVAGSEGGLTVTEDSVWMLTDKAGVLSRIDPDTNKVVAEITTPAGCYDAASGFGSVWVTCTEANLVLRVNPRNNLIEQRIAVPGGPRFLATGEGAVWTLNEVDGSVTRVDPKTNKVEATIDIGVPRGGDLAVGEGAVWASGFEFPLTRIDPTTNKAIQQWSGAGGDAVRVAFGSVWLSFLREGFIWRIDPRTL
jgi:virginiamycin B lyase